MPHRIFNTGLFDFETAHDHPLWVKELYGFADHKPKTEEYGISSFVYRARRPFDPQKIHHILTNQLPGVIRTKGHFWVATKPDWVAEFSLVGVLSSIKPLGTWWAAVPQSCWPASPEVLAQMREFWEESYGDRRQELVFIRTDMNKEALTASLDSALIDENSIYDPLDWVNAPDPLPKWQRTEEITV